jgi:hypothetical protein
MEKVFVCQRVANKLYSTEAAVDVAISEAAELVGQIIQARKDLKVSTVFADEAQVKLMDALKGLTEARTAMVGVHAELNEAQLRLGIRTRADWSKPPTGVSTTEQTVLREVV